MDLLGCTVKQLRSLCKDRGIKGISGKNKPILIKLLQGELTPSPLKSRGGASLASGKAYEASVQEILIHLIYKSEPIVPIKATSGASHDPDIPFRIGSSGDKTYAIEAKRKSAFEAGGKAFKLVDGALVLPETEDAALHRTLLGTSYKPFEGRIPSFKTGDKKVQTWLAEKHLFPEERILCEDMTVVAQYYKKQGSNYIQIENYGLYHTGEDPLGLGVPMFQCKVSLRVRCKQHGSSPLPGSVQVSINYDKKTMTPSPYDLMVASKLPPLLAIAPTSSQASSVNK